MGKDAKNTFTAPALFCFPKGRANLYCGAYGQKQAQLTFNSWQLIIRDAAPKSINTHTQTHTHSVPLAYPTELQKRIEQREYGALYFIWSALKRAPYAHFEKYDQQMNNLSQ